MFDPYTFESNKHTSNMPEIEYPNIYKFRNNSPSPYTEEEFKAYIKAWQNTNT